MSHQQIASERSVDRAPSVGPRTLKASSTPSPVARSQASGIALSVWVFAQRAILAAAVALLVGLVVLPRLGLYRPMTVLSASMRPTFSPGDLVLSAPEPVESVKVGQVISYRVPVGAHQIETHRIVRILQGGGGPNPVIQTRGDANSANDPWTVRLEGRTAWRQVAIVPKLGYLVNALRAKTLQIGAVLIAPILLVMLLLAEIWGSSATQGGVPAEGAERRERRERRVVHKAYFGPERRVGGDRRIGRSRFRRPTVAMPASLAGE